MSIKPSEQLTHLLERLRAAADEMASTTKEWERGAIAAKWLEFEIAPMLDKIDLNVETARIANEAVEAYLVKIRHPRDTLQMNSGEPRVLPGQTAQITNRPQRTAFRVDRIFMTPEVARDFVFEDISVGNRSQFQNTGPVPALAFLDDEPPFLPLETVQTAMDLVFVVRYVGNDEAGAQFMSIASGPAADERLPSVRRLTEQQEAILERWRQIVGGVVGGEPPGER
jgi:hypothetical protein